MIDMSFCWPILLVCIYWLIIGNTISENNNQSAINVVIYTKIKIKI